MRSVFVTTVLSFLVLVSFAQRVKIPIQSSRWYQLTNAASNLDKLFDGDTKTLPFPGWQLLVSPYEAYYPLLQGEEMTIDSVRMYDREGIFINTPVHLYAIDQQWQRKLIGTFTGERYLSWVGPYPNRLSTFRLDSAIGDFRYLLLQVNGYGFPAELELYGAYTPPTHAATPPAPLRAPLKQMIGINGFAWNFVDQSGSNIYISQQKLNGMKNFRVFRQYLDWQKSEPVEGRYYFSPQEGGGWPLDTIYKTAQENDIEMVATIQNITNWMMASYPDSLRAIDNNPAFYGSNLSDPASYIHQAKLGFQFTARYGRNQNVDPALVSVYTIPAWPGQKVNTKKIGLGTVKYIECGNEVDKHWRGRKGYLTAREYAANLSAFYDGHKGTLGPGVGVKQADSSMIVVMTGTASTTTEYFRAILDWCREFRGHRPDGQVDVCFDVINYHFYSNNAASTANGDATRGAAPEVTGFLTAAKEFVRDAHDYLNDMPVWLTECGYDINQRSPYKAIAIGNRSVLETQADWTLRTALLCAREGLQRCYFFQVYDLDANSSTKFASMGLLNRADHSRKPAADFLYQTNKLFGSYTFREAISNDPAVDRYEHQGQNMYALVVPDETGRTASYTLNLPGYDSAILYTPKAGSDDMDSVTLPTTAGQLSLTVTETPRFVVPFSPTADSLTLVISKGSHQAQQQTTRLKPAEKRAVTKAAVQVYPNPAGNDLHIQKTGSARCTVSLVTLQGSKLLETRITGHAASIRLPQVAAGIYALYLTNEKNEIVHSQFIIKK